VPRLAVGEGSMIKIIILSEFQIDYSQYNVYAAYDEGSIKVEGLKKTLTVEDIMDELYNFWKGWGTFLILMYIAIAFIVFVIYLVIKVSITKRKLYWINYMKIIDYVYSTFHQNNDQCLKRLDEIQKEITELFKKGELDEWNYDVLNKKISVCISLLEPK
jgi:hypothetical protein